MSDPSPPSGTPIGEGLGYTDALAELESILARLESTAVDVDELGHQVRRAAALIEHCRRRLRGVEQDVAGVLSQLGQLAAEPGAEEGSPP